MRTRPSPYLLLAVVVLVLATGATGYAAGRVTSAQIQDDTIRSKDVRNATLTGQDVRNRSLSGDDVRRRSLPRTALDRRCAAGESAVFGGCVRRTATGPSSHQAAVDNCNRRNGRLPTILELTWIASHDEFDWADGNSNQYEFSGDYTGSSPYTPIGRDRVGSSVPNASAQLFWHHCVTY